MSPTCFCKPKVTDCPKCTRPDYSKIKPPSGKGNSGAMLKTKLYMRTSEAAA